MPNTRFSRQMASVCSSLSRHANVLIALAFTLLTGNCIESRKQGSGEGSNSESPSSHVQQTLRSSDDSAAPNRSTNTKQTPITEAKTLPPTIQNTRIPTPPTSKWPHLELAPQEITSSHRPRAIMLSAAWCQWCNVAKTELDSDPSARNQLGQDFELALVDVDRHPTWFDLPDFQGLPAFAFFDREGQLLLLRSGYLPLPQLVQTFEAIAHRIREGSIAPYPHANEGRKLLLSEFRPELALGLSPDVAKAELDRLELKIYLRINSHDGGFDSPARFPYPELLYELQRWRNKKAPPRVESWIADTVRSASRGSSPRLNNKALADFPFDATALQSLAKQGAQAGPAWRQGIDTLPLVDSYLGIQDPIDHGYFRYAAGPGWYRPHFERRALDNLSWAMLLRARGKAQAAEHIENFVEKTFRDPSHGLFAAVQHSNPFYYRLRKKERRKVPSPQVDPLWKLEVQARAARLHSRYCPALLRVPGERWPDELWSATSTMEHAGAATPNAVGELLLALASCSGKPYKDRGQQLLKTVVEHWKTTPLPENARLYRLAAGICALSNQYCRPALASTLNLEFDPNYPPPLVELAKLSDKI